MIFSEWKRGKQQAEARKSIRKPFSCWAPGRAAFFFFASLASPASIANKHSDPGDDWRQLEYVYLFGVDFKEGWKEGRVKGVKSQVDCIGRRLFPYRFVVPPSSVERADRYPWPVSSLFPLFFFCSLKPSRRVPFVYQGKHGDNKSNRGESLDKYTLDRLYDGSNGHPVFALLSISKGRGKKSKMT